MRRFLCLFVACLCLLAVVPAVALAEGYDCKSCLVVGEGQQTPLLERKGDVSLSAAGLCKLPAVLTLCRAFDNEVIEENTLMSVSRRAAGISGPTAFLEAGEQIAAGELLKAAVMLSAGDALCTLGENAFGSESVFCQNISVTCRELGVEKEFSDCTGAGMTFTAGELALLGLEAARSPSFCRWAGVYMDEIVHLEGRRTELVNANRMLRSYGGCFGLMTGSSAQDGYCGVFAAKKNDTLAVAVVLGAPNSQKRFAIAGELLDHVFANYRQVTAARAGSPLAEGVEVRSGSVKQVDLVSHDTVAFLRPKGEEALEKTLEVTEPLTAPLRTDTPVGTVTFRAGEEVLCTIDLYPGEDVESRSYLALLRQCMEAYIRS